VVEHDVGRNPEAASAPTSPLQPKPGRDQVLVLPCREVNQAVDGTANTQRASRMHAVHQKLWGVASLRALLGRDEAFLCCSGLVQTVPVVAGLLGAGHAQNANESLVVCQQKSKATLYIRAEIH
jgi:hypothetical protein